MSITYQLKIRTDHVPFFTGLLENAKDNTFHCPSCRTMVLSAVDLINVKIIKKHMDKIHLSKTEFKVKLNTLECIALYNVAMSYSATVLEPLAEAFIQEIINEIDPHIG